MTGSTPELHEHRVAAWAAIVLGTAVGFGALVGNRPALVVAGVIAAAGALGYLGYKAPLGWKRNTYWVAGALLSIVAVALLVILPVEDGSKVAADQDASGIEGSPTTSSRVEGPCPKGQPLNSNIPQSSSSGNTTGTTATPGAHVENVVNVTAVGPRAFSQVLEPTQLHDLYYQRLIPTLPPDTTVHFWSEGIPRDLDEYTTSITIRFTLVGDSAKITYVTGVDTRILTRTEPLSGTLVESAGEGVSTNSELGFDLDCMDTSARVVEDDAVTSRAFLDEVQISLAQDEPVTLIARAFTSTCFCTFVLDIRLSDGSVIEVNDGGQPWRITAFAQSYQRAYAYGPGTQGNFVECPYQSPDQIHRDSGTKCR